MKFREYYSQIEEIIKECPIVTHFSIDFDEIDSNVGYLKGRLELIDASVLHFIDSWKSRMILQFESNISINGSLKMIV